MDAETIKKAVKILEWLDRDYYYAYVPTFPTGYSIGFEEGKWWLTLDGIRKVGETTFSGPYETRDDAVYAAQADYEARIISALSPEFLSALDTQSSRTGTRFERLRDAYIRGMSWRDANGSLEGGYKAACDYADYETSPITAAERNALSTPNPGDADGWRGIEEINVKEGERFYAAEPDGDGWVVGVAVWCKTPHVPLYGFHFTEGDPENWNMCKPTLWQPLPAPPASSIREGEGA